MSNINSENYYEILGIPKNSQQKDIKKAYRKLAVKYHPDKNKENKELAEKNFKKVNEAYSVLSNKEQKDIYDKYGKNGLENGGGMSHANAHEIFSTFFGNNDPLQSFFNNSAFSGVHFSQHTTNSSPFNFSPNFSHQFHSSSFNTQSSHSINRNDIIENNTQIIVQNLKTSSHLNGKIGKILDYNDNNNRYIVKLRDGKNISLSINNIHQILDIEITGLTKNTTLNGNMGKTVGFDPKSNRYKVLVDDEVIALKNDNIIISNNSSIEIVDLQNNVNINGKRGKIISYDRSTSKYTITLSNNKKIKIKKNNVSI